jgi:hypothetical protein
MQRAQRLAIEQRIAVTKADLRDASLCAPAPGRSSADLGVERTVVASLDAIETARLVRDRR